jgi:hypothetical protein
MNREDTELLDQVQEQIQEFVPEYNNEDFKDLGLTPQEIFFAYLTVKHNNPTQAYEEAFGVPYKTALVQGKKLEKNPKIKEAIAILYDEIWKEAMAVLPIRLLRDLESIRTLNVASYMAGDRYKNPEDLTEEQQLMLEGIEFQTNNKTGETLLVYKFPNKGTVYSKYLELIKMQRETTKEKESTATDREAADMVKSIFGGLVGQ